MANIRIIIAVSGDGGACTKQQKRKKKKQKNLWEKVRDDEMMKM